jgi:hypothetical protein
VRDNIVTEIKERKKREKLKEWLDELRESSDVYINDELLNKK